MSYIAAEDVAKAKEMDLLTYLRNYEPQELVHVSGNTYCTREHDSLRISNGKWCWFSQGIGGRSALDYESKFYLIGEGHKEFLADKTRDLDYYVLALAAIARELNIRKMTCGKIRIAAGLPLTWVSGQRDEFRDYLLQNKAVDFSFRNVSYHVEIVGVDVFPQGFAAVADRLSDFRGVNMICDIGNGTMNIMFINDKKPVSGNMFTEKYGTHQCLLAVRENVMRAHAQQNTRGY